MTKIDDTPPAWDDRTQLTTFLDYARNTARAKCAGVSAENARKALLPGSPLMTMSGIINHLRWVEYYWFQVIFLGEEDRAPMTDEDPDGEMRIAVDFPLTQLLDEYEEQSARYRELAAGTDLAARAKETIRDGLHVDLRWILLHLTEETARHNGHLDILRELLDGTTGNPLDD
ncbi:DinB family protein [Streptomyces sp. NPDC091272]|uniref:DinB family protein n=1 Tax=Streptomyces sp. NPDC091272 TaxID=3365981 RepID=UPI00380434DF